MTTLMAVWLPYDVTLTFPSERRIFLRERKAGLYVTSAFYTARILADAPSHLLSSIILGATVWALAGLHINLGYFLIIMMVSVLIGAAIMQVLHVVIILLL